jgi:pimeloyl-ACP methyl ester carboxylesterase
MRFNWAMLGRVIGGGLGLLALLNQTIGRLPSKPPASGEFAAVAGRSLHYTDNRGDGPPVVLLHGMSSTHADFERVLPLLAEGHPRARVVAIDRPGYGWSRGGPASFIEQVDAVHELLQKAAVAPATVVGHSMGATVALGLAIRHPGAASALVLVAPAAGGCRNGSRAQRGARLVQTLHRPGVKQFGDLFFNGLLRKALAHTAMRRAYGADGIDAAHMRRVLSVTLSDENLDAIAEDRLEFNPAGEWIDARCGSLAAPAWIVSAADDHVVPLKFAHRLAKMLPLATVRETVGGHPLPQTNPKAVAETIDQALVAQEGNHR